VPSPIARGCTPWRPAAVSVRRQESRWCQSFTVLRFTQTTLPQATRLAGKPLRVPPCVTRKECSSHAPRRQLAPRRRRKLPAARNLRRAPFRQTLLSARLRTASPTANVCSRGTLLLFGPPFPTSLCYSLQDLHPGPLHSASRPFFKGTLAPPYIIQK